MKRNDRRRLMAWIAGELDEREAARLRDRIEHEPALARAYRSLLSAWKALDGESGEPKAPDLLPRVMSAVRRADSELRAANFRSSPLWVRTAAAFALVAGIGMGALIGTSTDLGGDGSSAQSAVTVSSSAAQVVVADSNVSTLAEDYWQALIETNGSKAQSTGAGQGER
ncbi:MAG TPA: hypothetical protein VKA53_10765 [Thermoanaerobaculia bacterium]|nr:hypothetical protein [Thermoanaerobaculia bacterium]